MTYLPVALGSLLLQYMPTEYPLLPPCMYITALHCNAAPHAWLMLSCCRHTITDGDFTRRWLKRNFPPTRQSLTETNDGQTKRPLVFALPYELLLVVTATREGGSGEVDSILSRFLFRLGVLCSAFHSENNA